MKPAASDKVEAEALRALIARVAKGKGPKLAEARVHLRSVPAAELLPHVLDALASEDVRERRFALEFGTSVANLRASLPIEHIVRALGDPDPKVRNSGLLAANSGHGPMNEPVYLPQREVLRGPLEAMAHDEVPALRKQSAVVAARLGLK